MMMRIHGHDLMGKHLRGSSLFVIGAIAAAQPVLAQQAPEPTMPGPAAPQPVAAPSAPQPATADSGAIIVTAQRRSENVQNVPISISVLGGAALEASRPFGSVDLSQSVPNLNVRNVGVPVAHVFIRGVGNSDFNQNTATSVGTYVDEVFIASPIQQSMPIFDLERVEVLKGPQGTLYGANTSGGALSYVSNKPSVTGDLNGMFSISYGRYNERIEEGAVGVPLIQDKLAIRIAFISNVRDGTSYNIYSGSNVNKRNEFGGRVQLLYKPTERLSLLASVSTRQRDADFGTGTFRPLIDSAGLYGPKGADVSYLYEKPGAPLQIPGLTNSAGATVSSTNPLVTNYNFPTSDHIHDVIASLHADYDFGDLTLTSISAFVHEKYSGAEDTDFSQADLISLKRNDHDSEFTQEVRLSTNGTGPFKAVAGAYYLHRNLVVNNFDNLLGDAGFTINQFYIDKTNSYALFGQASYDLTDKLTVTGGVRYTADNKSFFQTNHTTAGSSVTDPGPAQILLIPPTTVPTKDRVFTGRVAVDYKLTRDAMVYASASRGFRSGGVTGGELFSPLNLVPYKPEFVNAFEVGTKTSWFDRRLTVNLSAFYYDYKDLQVFEFQPTFVAALGIPGTLQQTTNASQAQIYGGELEINGRLGDRLKLNGGVGYLHSKYENFIDPNTGENYSGNKLVNAPTWDINGGIVHTTPLSDKVKLELRGNISYLSKHYTDQSNLRAFLIPNDTRVDLAAAILTTIGDKKVRFELWGRNVFNHIQPVDIVPLRAFGYDLIWFNDPATYGVKAAIEF
jgi:iron complex outermembrane receptor protein